MTRFILKNNRGNQQNVYLYKKIDKFSKNLNLY